MKLTVIIPVYRVEQTLNRCVESVLRQGIDDMEVILVDDGSPDRCPQMCDEWAKKDCRIRVIHQENGGLSDARNAGINVAKGEYITFVDSDDDVIPDTYRLLLQKLAEHPEYDIIEYPVIGKFPLSEKVYYDMQLAASSNGHHFFVTSVSNRNISSPTLTPSIIACSRVYSLTTF